MSDLEFISNEIVEMNFFNQLDAEEEVDMEVEISVELTLNYNEDDRVILADGILDIEDGAREDAFGISLHTLTMFSYIGDDLTDDIRRQYHVQAMNVINPIWNEILANISAMTESPLIELETPDMDDADIVFEDRDVRLN